MFDSAILVNVGHLLAKVARAGMDNEINVALIILIQFNEVIAATERPDGFVNTTGVFQLSVAVQFGDKLLRLSIYLHLLIYKRFEAKPVLSNNLARRYISPDVFMEGVKVNVLNLSKIKNAHTATYINAHNIRDNLVAKITGEPNHTSGPGMNVRHDTYFLVGEHVNREQDLYLLQRILFNVVREYLHVISVYCLHKRIVILRAQS